MACRVNEMTVDDKPVMSSSFERRQYANTTARRHTAAHHDKTGFTVNCSYIARSPLHFYAIVLEYCAPVWHYAITRSQAEQLESIQKRAIHIIYLLLGACHILIYCSSLNLPPGRDQRSRSFFQDISHPSSSLYH